MREEVIRVVEKYIDSVRRNDADGLPLHADVVWEFPMSRERCGVISCKPGAVFSGSEGNWSRAADRRRRALRCDS